MLQQDMNPGVTWRGLSTPRSDRFYPGKETPAPIVQKGWVGSQDRSGLLRKISPPPGFDPRTFQRVASRYIGHAIPVNNYALRKDWRSNILYYSMSIIICPSSYLTKHCGFSPCR